MNDIKLYQIIFIYIYIHIYTIGYGITDINTGIHNMKYWLYNHIIDNIALMGSYILFLPTEGVIHIIILQLKLQLVAIVINGNKCTKWK